MEQVVERLRDEDRLEHVDAVVHRVVHGGTHFPEPAVIDDQALERLRQLGELAPLHNSRAVEAIEASRRLLGPDMAMVATFDTTFHARMPRRAASYALPRSSPRSTTSAATASTGWRTATWPTATTIPRRA